MKNPRDKVVDAMLVLAARHGYGDVTLGDIAHEAGLSLADLRDLFPSKGAIVGGLIRRIDRKVLDSLREAAPDGTARERLFTVLSRRLEALDPYRDSLAGLMDWARGDPLTLTALNREVVNSMRYMLEAAEIECDGPSGALKLQGLAFSWAKVIDAWISGGLADGLNALDAELTRGERYVAHAEDVARFSQPVFDALSRLAEMAGWRGGRRHPDDDFPHPGA